MAELAIAQLAADRTAGAATVAVNVSPRSLASRDYLRRLSTALHEHDVSGERLLVEVTERSLLDRTGAGVAGLAWLERLGVRVGIDDFGTGYSALGRFDLAFIKVDRSFVAKLGQDPRSDAVVSAIVALGHAHSLTVTAEGVETDDQAAALAEMGCDSGQGWHFGRPVPGDRYHPAPARRRGADPADRTA
jgi:EAL domain-containing protein (putative c-di-GMP-specific phosphodiesterase class I)